MIASLKEATNRIHQLLQCSRCHELLQDPVALPCMHRFCRHAAKPPRALLPDATGKSAWPVQLHQ
eukprot:2118297-Pleurochrysis_carterae.AAC.1